MADVTPPVGLAHAAAAISGGESQKQDFRLFI